MFQKFRSWRTTNDVEISWFVIGWMVAFGIAELAQGLWISALISFFIGWVNYVVRSKR